MGVLSTVFIAASTMKALQTWEKSSLNQKIRYKIAEKTFSAALSGSEYVALRKERSALKKEERDLRKKIALKERVALMRSVINQEKQNEV